MADETNDQTTGAGNDNVDLSSLSSFSLGPDWVSGNKTKSRLPKQAFEDDKPAHRGPHKDRRGPMARNRPRFDRDSRGPRRERPDYPERQDRFEKREPFKPILEVDFYPEEEPFKVLSQAIKTSCRTFELFEIARLILDKPERFVCVVRHPHHKEGEPARLWACVPDGLPFQNEDEAMAHTFRHYMGEFFTLETVEVDGPAGSFQMVHKCGMTGTLLSPPNYHRYQAICREHHAAKLSHVPYERFEQRIESSREAEDIQAWIASMKTQTRYTLKEEPEQVFKTLEDARLYLLTQAKDKLVRPAYSARFCGKSLALLNPGNPIRRSVEYLLEGQKRFPLETANHLRGRLRRMHFAVYKRGSKGVSFVCAVKRRFRKPDEVLADNLQKLIDFIEAKPNFPAKELPTAFLKLDSENDGTAIKKLITDLHYLVSQGYVMEYSDGRLFVPPIREDEVRHLEKLKAKTDTGSAKPGLPVVPVSTEKEPDRESTSDTQAETKGEPGTEPVAEVAVENDAVVEAPEVDKAVVKADAKPVTEVATEAATEADADEVTEPVTVESAEEVAVESAEEVAVESAEEVAEESAEPVADPVPEAVTEEAIVAEPVATQPAETGSETEADSDSDSGKKSQPEA